MLKLMVLAAAPFVLARDRAKYRFVLPALKSRLFSVLTVMVTAWATPSKKVRPAAAR